MKFRIDCQGIGQNFPPVFDAEKPETVTNCSAVEKVPSIVKIQCEPGHDGGLPQVFHLEVYSSPFDINGVGQLLVNRSMNTPNFTIKGLEKGQQYYFMIYSSNPKGPSGNLTLTIKTEEPVLKEVSCEFHFSTSLSYNGGIYTF